MQVDNTPNKPRKLGVSIADFVSVAVSAVTLLAVTVSLVFPDLLPWATAKSESGYSLASSQATGGDLLAMWLASAATLLLSGVLRRIPSLIRHGLILLAGAAILAVVVYNYGSVTGVHELGGGTATRSPGLGYATDGIGSLAIVAIRVLIIVGWLLPRVIGLRASLRESGKVRRIVTLVAVGLVVVLVCAAAVIIAGRVPISWP